MGAQEETVPIQDPAAESSVKRPYLKPVLIQYGDVRSLTMAPTPGIYESGLGAGFSEVLGAPEGWPPQS